MNSLLKNIAEVLAAPFLAAVSAWILSHFYAGRLTRNVETSERLFKLINSWLEIQSKVEELADSGARDSVLQLLDSVWKTLEADFQRDVHLPEQSREARTKLQRVLLINALKTHAKIWALLAYFCLFAALWLAIGLWRNSVPIEPAVSALMVLTPLSLAVLAWYLAYHKSR